MRSAISLTRNGTPAHLSERHHVGEIARAQHHGELPEIELGHEHPLVALEHLAGVRRKRVQVAKMRVCDRSASRRNLLHRLPARTARPAPGEHEQVSPVGAVHVEIGDQVDGVLDLAGPELDHVLVIVRVVAHHAGAILLLETSQAVHETGSTRQCPRAREPLVTGVGQEGLGPVAGGGMGNGDGVEVCGVGNPPGLGAVRDERIREHHHRRHQARCDAPRLHDDAEAVARPARREHRKRSLSASPVHHLEQIRLLGLGRKPGARPAALNAEHEQRQLHHHREPDRLGLERETGAARRGHAHRAAERGADRRGRRSDLVLGLEGAHTESLVPAELVDDVARGRDGIGGVEESLPRELGGSDEAEGEGLVAGDVAIASGASAAGGTW